MISLKQKGQRCLWQYRCFGSLARPFQPHKHHVQQRLNCKFCAQCKHGLPLLTFVSLLADGLRDYIAPSSPVLLRSPRQPLFLSSFNRPADELVPFPSTPPWYSMHSPSIPARSSEHISNSAEVHEAYAQQAQFRGMHQW